MSNAVLCDLKANDLSIIKIIIKQGWHDQTAAMQPEKSQRTASQMFPH